MGQEHYYDEHVENSRYAASALFFMHRLLNTTIFNWIGAQSCSVRNAADAPLLGGGADSMGSSVVIVRVDSAGRSKMHFTENPYNEQIELTYQ